MSQPIPHAVILSLLLVSCGPRTWEGSRAPRVPVALPPAAIEIVVDDQDGEPGFVLTGDNWATWGMPAGEGYDSGDTSYHYLTAYSGDGDRLGTATWTPTLPTAGVWELSTWFRRTENRSSDADHYIYAGDGTTTHLSLDQRGDGASAWVELGEFWCAAGVGGCTVLLDGDDGQSDEANAIRFRLVSGEWPEAAPCEEVPAPGPHTLEWPAGSVEGDDWEDADEARGTEDGREAHSSNVDAGETLSASGWELCDPPGDETIDAVRVGVRSRVQYTSGEYALELALNAGGDAEAVFSHSTSSWEMVEVTRDRPSWGWADLQRLEANLVLHDHPGGARDSDAWVDAFTLQVDFTTRSTDTGDDTGSPDTGSKDTGHTQDSLSPETGDSAETPDDEDKDTEARETTPPPGDRVRYHSAEVCGCASSAHASPGAMWLCLLALLRRRAGAPGRCL